jgi:hypothetical protein
MRPKNKRNPQDSNPLLLTPLILLTPFAAVFSPHCAFNTAASCARTSCAQRARFRSAESAAASMLQQHLMLLQCSAVQCSGTVSAISRCHCCYHCCYHCCCCSYCCMTAACCQCPSSSLATQSHCFDYVALCRQHQQVTLPHSAVVL